MNSMTSSVTRSTTSNVVQTTVESARSKTPGSSPNANIKWENFNYPPFIRLIHYDPNEIEDLATRSLIKKINLTFILNLVVSLLNFINSIAQVAVGFSGLKILFSVLNILIFVPVTLFTFYKGYRGLVYDRRQLRYYYIGHFVCAVAFFIFSIVSGGNYNGWTRLSVLFGDKHIFQGLLAIAESIIYLINSALCAYCLFKVYRSKDTSPPNDNRL